jgi:hypothetical protein
MASAPSSRNRKRPTFDLLVRKVWKASCADSYQKLSEKSATTPGRRNAITSPNDVEVTSLIAMPPPLMTTATH